MKNNRRGTDRRQAKNNAIPWTGPERRKGTDRRRSSTEMILTALEPRVLFSGVMDYTKPDIDMPASFDVGATQETLQAQAGAAAGPTVPVSGAVPILHSRPSATAKLIIDFDGDGAYQWGSYSVPATPAYDQDGDPSTFNTAELASINEIFLRVSEKYSPFNIDVTTEDPGTYNNKVAVKVIVGGNSNWLGSVVGGIAYVGGFYNLTDNKAYVFPANLANGYAKYTAEAIAHEAGHTFGLQHQGQYSGTTLVQEYNPGNSQVAPIMGNSYYAARGLWWYGTPSNNSSATQDDLSKVSSLTNAFGYRVDDYGSAADAATGLTLSGGAFSAAGVIEQYTDADYFSFSTTGAATLTLNLSVAQYGAMLDGSLFVYNSSGTLLASADTSSLGESLTLSLGGAGTYYVSVASHGGYGDMGQYTLTGSVAAAQDPQTPVVVADPSGLTVTPVSAGEIVLGWADNSDNEDGFIIQRSTDNGVTWTTLATTGAGVTGYNDWAVSGGRTYYYRVQAYNSSTSSSYTAGVSGTTVPPAPGTPVATANSTTQITVTWSDVTGETGYSVERSTDGGSTWSQIGTTGAGVTSFVDTGLTAGATYYYRVRAQDGTGWSAYSSAGGTVTLPAAPGSISATANSASQVTVTWSDVAGETGYVIERSLDGSTGWTQVGTTGAGVTTFADTGRSGGTRYYYRVRASNGSGSSAYTSVANALTVPAAPGTPVVTANSTTQVTVTWADVAGETGYAVERSADGGSTWTQVGTTTADLTTYIDTGLAAGAMYYYRVRAQDGTGWSGYSAAGGAVTLPVAPGTLAATANTVSQITVTWSDVAGETGYVVERSPDGSTGWAQVGSTTAGVTTFVDTGRSGGTQYYYRVRAVNGSGSSAYSSVTGALTVPAAPGTPAVTANSASQVTVVWSDVTGETGYSVERSTDGGSTWTPAGTTAAGVTSFIDTGLAAGASYAYRVRAQNGTGWSGYSSSGGAVTVPATPGTISATANSATQVTVTWADVAGETGYVVERSLDGTSGWAQAASTSAGVTTFVDTGRAGGTRYYYRVRAANGSGSSAYTSVANALTLPVTPTGVTATPVSATRATVTWGAVTGSTSYVVERSPDNVNWSTLTTTGTTTVSDMTLSAGTKYYYRVSATNTSGASGTSSVASVTTVPAAPGAPVATANSATQVTVGWSDVTGETLYAVERSADGGSTWAQVGTTGADVTSYVDAGLSAGSTYAYRVRALDATGWSAYSSEAGTVTVPTAPGSISATANSATQVTVTWADVAGETGYVVERSLDGTSGWTQAGTTGAGVTTFVDTGRAGGTRYYYRVRASNGSGSSDGSGMAVVLTLPNAPAAMTEVTATADSASKITVEWQVVTGASSYDVERSADGSTGWTRVATGVTGTSYLDDGLAAGTSYYYRVRAVNVSGASPFSGAVVATTQEVPVSVVDPTLLTATPAGAAGVDVAWQDNSNNEDGFVLERSGDGGATWVTVVTTNPGVTAYADTGLTGGTTYVYRVRAFSGAVTSGYAAAATVTTVPEAPATPTVSTVSARMVRVSWAGVAGATGYVVEASVAGTGAWAAVGTVGGDVTEYAANGLSAGTAYSFRVRAVGVSGTSDASAPATAVTRPGAPGGVTAQGYAAGQLYVSWAAVAGADGYVVERSADGASWDQVGTTTGAGQTALNDTTVAAGTTYYYRVHAVNAGGVSEESAPAAAVSQAAAPGNAAATAVSAGQVRVTWDTAAGAAGYVVERSADGMNWSTVGSVVGATSYDDWGLLPNTAYSYRVRSVNDAGTSGAGYEVAATTQQAAPVAPAGLSVTPVSTEMVQLSWEDRSGNESGFKVEYSTNGGRTWELAGSVRADTNVVRVTGLEQGQKYTFRVSAYNEMGFSGTTNKAAGRALSTKAMRTKALRRQLHKALRRALSAADATPAPAVLDIRKVKAGFKGLPKALAPEAATELVATPYATSAVQLTWTDNADSELGYRVEYSANGRVWLLAGYVKPDQTGCRVTGLLSGEAYKFRVSAYNLAGTTKHSATTRAVMPSHKPKWSIAHPSSEPDQDTVLNVNRVKDVAPGLPANLRVA